MPLGSGPFLSTASSGGDGGFGALYEVARTGEFSVLHPFDGTFAATPSGPVARDATGNIYGTTANGGGSDEGTIFKFSADGKFTVLHEFNGGGDGSSPASGLVFGPDGALYGTSSGGAHGQGVLFRITTAGAFAALHQFNGDEGAGPRFRLSLLANDQMLYGVAGGGSGGAGAIFRFNPAQTGNHPPVGADDLAFMPLKQGPLTIAVLANDTDPDNDPLSVTSVTDGQYGTVSNNHDGTVTYVPGPLFSFVRDDAFLYGIDDGHGSGGVCDGAHPFLERVCRGIHGCHPDDAKLRNPPEWCAFPWE